MHHFLTIVQKHVAILKIPEGELGQEIRAKFDNNEIIKVTVLKAMGEEAMMSYKVEQDSRK